MNGPPVRPSEFQSAEEAAIVLAFCAGAAVFFACWIYAALTYGWFLGISLGWIPSAFFGVVAALIIGRSLLALPALVLDALLAFGFVGIVGAGVFGASEALDLLAAWAHR
jgi:hypothetical protein